MKNDDKIVELSKTKILLLVIGALGFVALGIWLYQLDPAWIEAQRRFNNPWRVHGIGIASAVFFGLCGAVGIKKLFDKKPGLGSVRNFVCEPVDKLTRSTQIGLRTG